MKNSRGERPFEGSAWVALQWHGDEHGQVRATLVRFPEAWAHCAHLKTNQCLHSDQQPDMLCISLLTRRSQNLLPQGTLVSLHNKGLNVTSDSLTSMPFSWAQTLALETCIVGSQTAHGITCGTGFALASSALANPPTCPGKS